MSKNLKKKIQALKNPKKIEDVKNPPSTISVGSPKPSDESEDKIYRTKKEIESNEKFRKRENNKDEKSVKGKGRGKRKTGDEERGKGKTPSVPRTKTRRGYFDWFIDGGGPTK